MQEFRLTRLAQMALLASLTLSGPLSAWAEPIAIESEMADDRASAEADDWDAALDGNHDVETWVQEESTRTLLAHAADETRQEVLQQAYQPRPPTWIQSGALSGVAGSSGLDDAERAERDLQTLNWVIEQQQREAAARREGRGNVAGDGTEDDRWFRRLLPQHWIPVLKANREWVVAGGTSLLVLVWGASLFARRPSSSPLQAPAAPAKPVKRRRRHRRSGLQWQ
ncbi:MAG: hypothetical protein H6933_16005 [Burkholderiaceae bacterium]|nr:hypothetical protein [Rhodoferax sp.]MCP5285539.1 hypothetical protein [Burkholderiaceae bacterium]MCP5286390.1 hypothetical protein [Burkholderiaceae bacterium]